MMLSHNFLNWKRAQWKVNNCSKKDTKGEKEKANKNKTPKDVDHFLVQKLKILVFTHAGTKMLQRPFFSILAILVLF